MRNYVAEMKLSFLARNTFFSGYTPPTVLCRPEHGIYIVPDLRSSHNDSPKSSGALDSKAVITHVEPLFLNVIPKT